MRDQRRTGRVSVSGFLAPLTSTVGTAYKLHGLNHVMLLGISLIVCTTTYESTNGNPRSGIRLEET